jgi:hypothetical protein
MERCFFRDCRHPPTYNTYYCEEHQNPLCMMGGCYEQRTRDTSWCPAHRQEPLVGTILVPAWPVLPSEVAPTLRRGLRRRWSGSKAKRNR